MIIRRKPTCPVCGETSDDTTFVLDSRGPTHYHERSSSKENPIPFNEPIHDSMMLVPVWLFGWWYISWKVKS